MTTAMEEQSCRSLLVLPCDLFLNILSRINYTQIVKLRCVCKFLLSLTTKDPRFVHSFQQLYIKSCILHLLPTDLLLNILHRIDYTQIVRLRCVCKFLRCLTTKDSRFIDSFQSLYINEILRRYHCRKFHILKTNKGKIFIYSEKIQQLAPFSCPLKKRLIGSCNGFLCFDGGAKTIEIYSIAAPVRFSISPCSKGDNNVTIYFHAYYGFGYDLLTQDYKVVCFMNRHTGKIFSIRRREWRYIRGFGAPLDEDLWSTLSGSSICTWDGVICWPPSTNCMDKILMFNLYTERFRVIQRPASTSPRKDLHFLMVYQGDLTLAYLKIPISSQGGGRNVLDSKVVCRQVTLYSKYEYEHGENFPIYDFSPQKEVTQIVSFDDGIYLLWFEGKHAKLFNVKTQCSKILQLSSSDYYPTSKPAVKCIDL